MFGFNVNEPAKAVLQVLDSAGKTVKGGCSSIDNTRYTPKRMIVMIMFLRLKQGDLTCLRSYSEYTHAIIDCKFQNSKMVVLCEYLYPYEYAEFIQYGLCTYFPISSGSPAYVLSLCPSNILSYIHAHGLGSML